MRKETEPRKGFVAIISAVVIAALMLAITFSLNASGFFARFNVLEFEYKERSSALAEACAEDALLKLAASREYAGDETVSLGALSCRIFPVTQNTGEITVKTRAFFPANGADKAVTNLVVVVGSADLNIISWEEVPNQT